MERKSRFLVIGSGTLAFECAKQLKNSGQSVVLIEYALNMVSTTRTLCNKEGISYLCRNKTELINFLSNLNDETIIVSASNSFVFPVDICNKKSITIINWHNALLPNHKGRNAEAWAIYENDSKTGITWHIVDDKIDHGRIIYQSEIEIDETTTALSLFKRQMELGIKSFNDVCLQLIRGKLLFINTNIDMDGGAIHYSKDIPNNGYLDLRWSTKKISRLLRAMDYGRLEVLGKPYTFLLGGKYCWDKYKIMQGTVNSNKSVQIQGNDMVIDDGYYCIILKKVERIE